MRVIAGSARGTKLAALPGEDVTRPTIDRVKEAMFSSLQFSLPGARVLDLFGGSGQLGIEALSRGAAHCTFLDQDRDAVNIIMANCKAAGVFKQARVTLGEAERFLGATAKDSFHIVLMDPPYGQGTIEKLLPLVDKVLMPGGILFCESELSASLPDECGGLKKAKQKHYGKILVTRYEKDRAEEEIL